MFYLTWQPPYTLCSLLHHSSYSETANIFLCASLMSHQLAGYLSLLQSCERGTLTKDHPENHDSVVWIEGWSVVRDSFICECNKWVCKHVAVITKVMVSHHTTGHKGLLYSIWEPKGFMWPKAGSSFRNIYSFWFLLMCKQIFNSFAYLLSVKHIAQPVECATLLSSGIHSLFLGVRSLSLLIMN